MNLSAKLVASGSVVAGARGADHLAAFIRTDSATVEDALTYVISHYASRVWGSPLAV